MQRIYIKAFNQLKKLGVPVYVHPDDDGNFSIDAESSNSSDWANYYGQTPGWAFGVNPKIDEVLEACGGLFCEWVNPGRLAVHA